MMKKLVMHRWMNHFIVLKQEIMNIGRKEICYLKEGLCFFGRLILRCRQLARVRFAKMRSDVLVKLELLDQKHGLSFISHSSFHFFMVY